MNVHLSFLSKKLSFGCQVLSWVLLVFLLASSIACKGSGTPDTSVSKVEDVPWDGDPNTIPSPLRALNPLAHPEAKKGGRFLIYSHQFPKSLNYYLNQFTTTARIFTSLFESLAIYHPLTLEPMPHLAKKWDISADKKSFTFYMDENARWSDGKPITAHDVLFTYNTIMDKNNNTATFRIGLSRFKTPQVLDDYIIRFEVTDSHWNNFNEIASGLWILPKHVYEGKDFNRENFEFPVVSGPYKLVESRKGRYVKLERRGDWWQRAYPFNKGRYNFDQIMYKVYNEETIALQAFKKGDIDIFPVYTASVWVQEANGEPFDKNWVSKLRVYNKKPTGFQGWAMNMRREPFTDVRVRKAIAHLVDRDLMIEKLAYNEYEPTNSYFPDFYLLGAKNPNEAVKFNMDKARALLRDAGWVPNARGILEKNGKQFEFTILDRDKKTEKYFTIFLERARDVGIIAKIETTDLAAWSARVDKYDFDMTWAAWGSGIFKDPEAQWFSKYADEEGQPNLPGFKNNAVDAIIQKQKTEFNISTRNTMLKELDKIVYKEYPYVLLWHVDNNRLLFWNKFGMPEAPLGKYGDENFASDYWYFDEDRAKKLNEAMKSKTSLETSPSEIRWKD